MSKNKTPPKTDYTIDEWYEDREFPVYAVARYDIPTKNLRRFKKGSDIISFEAESGDELFFKPTKMFDDPSAQREYLIDEIRKLYSRDKTKYLRSISFGGSRLSQYDQSRIWPAWSAKALGEWLEIRYQNTGAKKTIFVAYQRGAKLPGIKPSQIFHENETKYYGGGNWRKKIRAPIESFSICHYHGFATEAQRMMNKNGTWKGID